MWVAVGTGKHVNEGVRVDIHTCMHACLGACTPRPITLVHLKARGAVLDSQISVLLASFDHSLGLIILQTVHLALKR